MSQGWSSGLLGCCGDCGSCCLFMICPCALFVQNQREIEEGGCFGHCCLYTLLFTCVSCRGGSVRRKLREKYNLPEDPCSDCCVHFWCHPLAVCQEARELKYHRHHQEEPSSYNAPGQS